MLKRLFGAALFCSLATSQALAQPVSPPQSIAGSTDAIDEIRESDAFHLGPVYVEPAIRLKELGVDTNVFNQWGNEQSDFTFTVTPRADIALPVARAGLLKAAVGADLVYFAQFVGERSVDPRLLVRAERYARHLTLFVEGSHENTRERPNYEIDVRARHVNDALSAGASVAAASRVSLELAARRSSTRFDGDDFAVAQSYKETLDRDSNTYSATTYFEHSILTSLGLLTEYQTDRFIDSPSRDTDSFRIMPGVTMRSRALVSGAAWIGYRTFKPKSSALQSQSRLVSKLALSYTLLGETIFTVTYDRDYQWSYETAFPYFIDSGVRGSIRRAIGSRYDVIITAARYTYDYQALAITSPAVPALTRLDRIRNYGADIGYRVKRGTRVGLGASWWQRESNLNPLHAYKDLRIGLTMAYEL
jgi:hypothetical protein